MNIRSVGSEDNPQDQTIRQEAIDLVLRIEGAHPDIDDSHKSHAERNAEVLNWVMRSPEHLRQLWWNLELKERLARVDSRQFADLLSTRSAHGYRISRPCLRAQHPLWHWMIWVTVALVVTFSVYHVIAIRSTNLSVYSTQIGEISRYVLSDGSTVILNTDTQLEVEFGKDARNVRLIRGEADFHVIHEPHRPFVVSTVHGWARAIGTQFNVRRTPQVTKVTVIEGIVQTATNNYPVDLDVAGSAPTMQKEIADQGKLSMVFLKTGDMAQISSGTISKVRVNDINSAMSWLDGRLLFRNARLTDIAEEFNRYNSVHIRVEGPAAESRVTANFDVSEYQAFLGYVQALNFYVEADGLDWVIRANESKKSSRINNSGSKPE